MDRRVRRVVTPEAVALDLQTATVATRGLGALLDVLLQGVAALLVAVALAAINVDSASGTVFVTIVLLAIFLIRIGYPVAMEATFGATLGHMALGLRVVTLDGSPIRLRQAVTRVAVGLFELDATLGSVALLVAAARTDGRRLGDLAAGTQVVSVRVGTGRAAALELEVPPRLQAWAAALDTTGLAQPERAALRGYLARAADLPGERRDQLAVQLAERLLPRLAAARPPGASAHDTLVAIGATARGRSEDAASPAPPPPPPSPAAPQSPRAPGPPAPPGVRADDQSGFRPPS